MHRKAAVHKLLSLTNETTFIIFVLEKRNQTWPLMIGNTFEIDPSCLGNLSEYMDLSVEYYLM